MSTKPVEVLGLNLTVRFRNPQFVLRLIVAIVIPILTYLGMDISDLTTFPILLDAVKQAVLNPYVWIFTIVNVVNILSDPTTEGFTDSTKALHYNVPKKG